MLRTEEAAGTKQSASLVGPEKFLSSSSVKPNPSPAIERLEMRAIATVSCTIACACHLCIVHPPLQKSKNREATSDCSACNLEITHKAKREVKPPPYGAKKCQICAYFPAFPCMDVRDDRWPAGLLFMRTRLVSRVKRPIGKKCIA